MPAPETESCDLLIFAAHPDDAELCCGGLLLVSADRGWKTGVVDASRGELGSLGTPEIRVREAEDAARVLGLTVRRNLGLPDGRLEDRDEYRREIVRVVRELRPRLIVAPPSIDHHPDHEAVAELVRQSFYLCGVRKYLSELPPWRPRGLLHYLGSRGGRPQVVVDVTDVIDRRAEAIRCYRSQFDNRDESTKLNPDPGASAVSEEVSNLRIAVPYFMEAIVGHLRHYGSLIGVPYGEGYTCESPLPVTDLVNLFEREPWRNR